MMTEQKGDVAVKTYVFTVELKQEEDGRWSVWVPGLPGLTSWGRTQEEAFRNIQDAAGAYLEDMLQVGEPITLGTGKIEIREKLAVAVTI